MRKKIEASIFRISKRGIIQLCPSVAIFLASPLLAQDYTGSRHDDIQEQLLGCILSAQLDCIERTISAGADVNHPIRDITPLVQSVMQGDRDIVAKLLGKGANPHADSKFGTPIDIALKSEDMGLVKQLIRDPKELGSALLLKGSERGDIVLVRQGLELGAPVSGAAFESAPLTKAIVNGHIEITDLILKSGASKDLGNGPYLSMAIISGDTEMVKTLIRHGADLNATDQDGVLPLSISVTTGNVDMVETLLSAGADIKRKNADGTDPAMIAAALQMDDLAARLGGTPDLESVDLIGSLLSGSMDGFWKALQAGSDPSTRSPDGWPAVLIAIAKGDVQTVGALIKAGATLGDTGPDNNTALHMICAIEGDAQRDQMFRFLINNHPKDVMSLLSRTNRAGRSAIVALVNCGQFSKDQYYDFLAHDAAWRIKDGDGVTPALAALINDNIQLLHFLRTRNSYEDIFLLDGESFADVARQNDKSELLLLLPNDRKIDFEARLGMTKESIIRMQNTLKGWGYYTGAIDGSLGAGTANALASFLSVRGAEIEKSAKFLISTGINPSSLNGLSYEEHENGSVTAISGDSCEIAVYKWDETNSDTSTYAVACQESFDSNFDFSNASIFVKYKESGDQIILTGPEGWNHNRVKRFGL